MMKIITYDLNRPGQDYAALYKSIQALGDWVHPMQNTWFVKTSLNDKDVLSKLVYDAGDKIFVADITFWWSANLDNDSLTWMKSND